MTTPTELPEKMPLTSMDIAADKRDELKRCLKAAYPEVFAEDGIDFDQLKRVLGEWVEPDRERFGLNWPGKAACMKVIQAPSVGTLKPCRQESVDWDTTQNLFIEGDNLEVLKLLQKAYFGKVKMIYIDPPYNTGKEFIYPDKYAETLDTYLEYTGQKDADGRKFATNTEASGRYHSRWLNMIYPRLYLAKNLLRDDGVIFISIDDHEQENLKSLCHAIFGEENFITQITWQKKASPSNDAKFFSYDHEYVLLYAKKIENCEIQRLEMNDKQRSYYTNPDNDPRGPWNSSTYTCNKNRYERPNLYYSIKNPYTGEEVWPKETAVWAYSRERCEEHLKDNLLYWGKDGTSKSPRFKKFIADAKKVVPRSIWFYSDVGHTQSATKEIADLFDGVSPFSTPKPTSLIQQMLRIGSDSEAIVLDFFSGSASTCQAVMSQNIEDNGNRKFIAVQLPENVADVSDSGLSKFHTISDIAKERIRRSSQYIKTQNINGSVDLGFRSYKLSTSCFKQWHGEGLHELPPEQLALKLKEHSDHVDPNATPEDILYELLLKDGFELTVPIQRLSLAGKEVFSIAEGQLLICLEPELTQAVMDEMAALDPSRVIVLDAGFQNNDQLKANAVQTFKARARNKETAIVFRTV